jgi:ferrous iron transport protein A
MESNPDISSYAVPLDSLSTGERGVVVRIVMSSRLRRRLMEMGFVPGTIVDVVRWAPLADPIEYRLKGYYISLRRDEAKNILVRRLNGKGKRHRFRFGWRFRR